MNRDGCLERWGGARKGGDMSPPSQEAGGRGKPLPGTCGSVPSRVACPPAVASPPVALAKAAGGGGFPALRDGGRRAILVSRGTEHGHPRRGPSLAADPRQSSRCPHPGARVVCAPTFAPPRAAPTPLAAACQARDPPPRLDREGRRRRL